MTVAHWAWHEWLLYGGIFWLLVVTPVGAAIFVLLENWEERERRLADGESHEVPPADPASLTHGL
jgi:membrane protein required for beta-lactamase induction